MCSLAIQWKGYFIALSVILTIVSIMNDCHKALPRLSLIGQELQFVSPFYCAKYYTTQHLLQEIPGGIAVWYNHSDFQYAMNDCHKA